MKLFLSHATSGKHMADRLISDIKSLHPGVELKLFYSAHPSTGISAGSNIMSTLNDSLKESDLVIAFVTEDYVRSVFCWYELSIALYENKKIIPICFGDKEMKAVQDLLGNHTVYIDLRTEESQEALYHSLNKEFGFKDGYREGLFELDAPKGEKEYIGSGHIYQGVIKYCEENGIKRFKNCNLSPEEWKAGLSNSSEIRILSTTGARIVSILSSEVFPKLLATGTNITVMIPNKYSDFCKDVARVETKENYESNLKRFADEFDTVVHSLLDAISKARAISGRIGHVRLACANTLLRQTMTLSTKRDGSYWGWISMTIPPCVTRDGTPSFELSGKKDEGVLYSLFCKHFDAALEMARDANEVIELSDTPIEYFHLEKDNAISYWQRLESEARDNMREYEEEGEGNVLIEVAAQHPLKKGNKPNEEFVSRLDKAIEIYKQNEGTRIYVPGSRHQCFDKKQGKVVVDLVSLSTAGKTYLLEHGVKEDDIYADETNIKYKGDEGIYNSADECYAASQLFKDGEYSRLICICSPYQAIKKTLFYYANGLVPEIVTTSSKKHFHSPILESINIIPNILYEDSDWQGEGSKYGKASREERKPKE